MKRWLISLAAIIILAVPSSLLVAAQESVTPMPADVRLLPPVEGASSERQLDLSSLVLRPSDLADQGMEGFGLGNQSSARDVLTESMVQARGDEFEAARRLGAYREAGFRVRYVASMLRPRLPLTRLPSGLVTANARITSSVTEFASAEGAAASFALMEGDLDDVDGRDLPNARQIGEQSEVTLSRGREIETREPFRRLELSFRTGNLIGEVTIVNYDTDPPELELIEDLGDLLLARIEEARADPSPQISTRVARIWPFEPWISEAAMRDYYVRLDGRAEPTFAEIVNGLERGLDLADASVPPIPDEAVRPLDTYLYWTPVGTGERLEIPLYVAWVDRYPSPQQATAALSAVTNDLGAGYVDVQELPNITEPIGDGVRAFAYRYEGDPNFPVSGHLVIARIGEYLVRVQADGPDGVRRQGVAAMARYQIACLESTDSFCLAIPVDEAVRALYPAEASVASGTPVVTP